MTKVKLLIILNLVLLLAYFNYSAATKEEILNEGQLVLLELAPVDPRSLMQGDYMDLRYNITENIISDTIPKRGYCVVRLDNKGIAHKIRFQKEATPLSGDEHLIKYTSPSEWDINIGAESFFFQEGQSAKYEKAKYGGIKIDKNGNSLLIGLYDELLRKIE